jgi:hypothetical protein
MQCYQAQGEVLMLPSATSFVYYRRVKHRQKAVNFPRHNHRFMHQHVHFLFLNYGPL